MEFSLFNKLRQKMAGMTAFLATNRVYRHFVDSGYRLELAQRQPKIS